MVVVAINNHFSHVKRDDGKRPPRGEKGEHKGGERGGHKGGDKDGDKEKTTTH
jgi:hypothetical protein